MSDPSREYPFSSRATRQALDVFMWVNHATELLEDLRHYWHFVECAQIHHDKEGNLRDCTRNDARKGGDVCESCRLGWALESINRDVRRPT